MNFRLPANLMLVLKIVSIALLLFCGPSISVNNENTEILYSPTPVHNGVDHGFFRYRGEVNIKTSNKYFTYRMKHNKKEINYVFIFKADKGFITNGYLFCDDHDGHMQRVSLEMVCLYEDLQGIKQNRFSNSIACDIAYFKDGNIFVSKNKGYQLEQIEEAVYADISTAAITVETEVVLLHRMLHSYKDEECSNGLNFESGNYFRKCSKEHVLLGYDANKPVGIAQNTGSVPKYLAVFYGEENVIVLDGNYIFCGHGKNTCAYRKYRQINFQKNISFSHRDLGFIANEVLKIEISLDVISYHCIAGIFYKAFGLSGDCRNFKIEHGTAYLAADTNPQAMCNFRPTYFTLFDDFSPYEPSFTLGSLFSK